MCFLLLTNELSQFQFTSLLKKNRKRLLVKFQFHQPLVFPNSPLLRFSKTREFWSSKANWCLRSSRPLIILADLLENRSLWLVDFDPLCVSLRSFFACDRNYVDGSQKHNCEDSFWTSVFGSSSFIIYYWVYYKKKRKKDHLNRRRIVFSPYRRRTLSELTYATGRKREEDSKP